jgi:hypothetical protein
MQAPGAVLLNNEKTRPAAPPRSAYRLRRFGEVSLRVIVFQGHSETLSPILTSARLSFRGRRLEASCHPEARGSGMSQFGLAGPFREAIWATSLGVTQCTTPCGSLSPANGLTGISNRASLSPNRRSVSQLLQRRRRGLDSIESGSPAQNGAHAIAALQLSAVIRRLAHESEFTKLLIAWQCPS